MKLPARRPTIVAVALAGLLAAAATPPEVRDTLVISPAGWVLAHETTDLDQPSGMGSDAPHLRSYTLVPDRSQQASTGTSEATR